ncbi:MAG: hypothetical protein AAGF45_04015 [Pseudomonadota bacterium]
MRLRRIYMSGAAVAAALFAYQTIQAVGSHVPVEDQEWVPPTVAAGMAEPAMLLAANNPSPAHYVMPGSSGADPLSSGPTADISALAYFKERGDQEAMAAELARLTDENPAFRLDPEEIAGAFDEGALWEQLAAGDVEGVAHKIEAIEQQQSQARPSRELKAAVADAKARKRIETAVEEARWADVLAAARERTNILACADPQVLWWVGEAFARNGEPEEAEALYAFMLDHCDGENVKVATVGKASSHLDQAKALTLTARIAGEAGERAQKAVLRAILGDWLALREGDGEGDGRKTLAADVCPIRPGPDSIAGFAAERGDQSRALVRPKAAQAANAAHSLGALADSAEDLMLLGWYAASAERFAEADEWFVRALAKDAGHDATEGRVAAHVGMDKRSEALAIALSAEGDRRLDCIALGLARAELADGNTAVLPVVERFARALRSAPAAAQIGWRHMDANAYAAAKPWFAASMEYRANDDAAVGLAVAAERLGDRTMAQTLAKRHKRGFPRLAALAKDMAPRAVPRPSPQRAAASVVPAEITLADQLLEKAGAAYARRKYKDAAAILTSRKDLVGEARDVAMWRAWALHNSGQHFHAAKLFAALDGVQSTEESREGLYHSRKMMFAVFD